MKSLLVSIFIFCFFISKSQIFISRAAEDSMHKAEESNIGKSFESFTGKDVNGKTFSNNDLNGKITLVNFWFESCPPCVAEFDALNKIYERLYNNKYFRFIS